MTPAPDASVNKTLEKAKSAIPAETKALAHLINQAIAHGASDIHIEPRDRIVYIRFRIGNELRVATKLPIHALTKLSQVVKNFADLNSKELLRPQAGSFIIQQGTSEQTISVSIVPILGGEKIVLHLENNLSRALSLEEIGFWGENLKLLEQVFAKLRGMAVITSADRNANALTNLSIAAALNHPPLKVASVESPGVEELHSSLSPAHSALLSLDKQDPDVILLRSVTDSAVIATALKLAKHRLIIINLSAADAPTALQQLINIKEKTEHGLANIHVIVGQSILRKLCQNCKEVYRPRAELKKQIEKLLWPFSFKELHSLEKEARKVGLGSSTKELGSTSTGSITKLWQAHPGGCSHCDQSGYVQHLVINETLDVHHPRIQSCLNHAYRLSTLEAAALEIGMIPQRVDGLVKCLRGLINVQDLFAAIK